MSSDATLAELGIPEKVAGLLAAADINTLSAIEAAREAHGDLTHVDGIGAAYDLDVVEAIGAWREMAVDDEPVGEARGEGRGTRGEGPAEDPVAEEPAEAAVAEEPAEEAVDPMAEDRERLQRVIREGRWYSPSQIQDALEIPAETVRIARRAGKFTQSGGRGPDDVYAFELIDWVLKNSIPYEFLGYEPATQPAPAIDAAPIPPAPEPAKAKSLLDQAADQQAAEEADKVEERAEAELNYLCILARYESAQPGDAAELHNSMSLLGFTASTVQRDREIIAEVRELRRLHDEVDRRAAEISPLANTYAGLRRRQEVELREARKAVDNARQAAARCREAAGKAEMLQRQRPALFEKHTLADFPKLSSLLTKAGGE